MASTFPTSLDSFVNPVSSDTLNSATVPHAAQHDNINDAVVAIETALGTNLVNVGKVGSATPRGLGTATVGTSTSSSHDDHIHSSTVLPVSTSAVGLLVKGLGSQSGDLQEWQDSAGIVLAKVTADGSLYFKNAADSFIVNYLDGGSSLFNGDSGYDAGTSATTTWTYTIDAGASLVSF